jgi:hypothetical protein
MFAKCTICESLKDLIPKLEKNYNEALEYEAKLKNISYTKDCVETYTILGR